MRRFWVAALVAVTVVGCASSGKKPAHRGLRIPPGLDSTTVVRASRMADSNFVSSRAEKEAEEQAKLGKQNVQKVDAFWAYLEQRVKSESANSSAKAQFDRELAQGAESLARWKALTKNGSDEKAAEAALSYCQAAQLHLEQAVRINPFDKNARLLLSVTYYNLQHIFGLQKNHEKAIEVLERLTRIEKGEHELFRLLAENYLAMKSYEAALNNYAIAQTVLIKTSFDAAPDSSLLYNYAYMQADASARMYNANVAVQRFLQAKTYARSAQEKADVDNYLKWINWDGGNIRASEKWDEVLALEQTKNYQQMATACASLLPMLTTKKAKIALHHKLAVVEFEFLERKDVAVERMRQVFEALTPEQVKSGGEEVQPYLDSYGAMLYRLGVDARERQEKKLALAYFTKAVAFNWDQMAKAYVELVSLVWNTPEQAIFYGERALACAGAILSSKESCELLSMMVKAHKSAGLYDKAREYFTKWKQCQE